MTIKNATRRYSNINTDLRDCDDCTVQPRLTNAENERIRQETRELRLEAWREVMERQQATKG